MTSVTHYLKDYQPPQFAIHRTHLTFELESEQTIVTNTMDIERMDPSASSLLLDGEQQELVSVALNGEQLNSAQYILTEESLEIADVPDQFELTITTTCKPHLNTSLTGLYQSEGMYCTQCESHGFRRITYFLDRPDVMSIFTTKLIAAADQYPILLSNGNRIETGTQTDGRHFATWHDPHKKPSYLFALVAGDLAMKADHFTTMTGRKVTLEIYTKANDIHKVDHAMFSLKDSMRWDEENYGREYDLDIYMIVAVPDFNMGAMENKGLNVFNTKYVLANPETATDKDYELIHAVIGHEYFHNWTGNRVTCRDWFQLSLKEGLTVFRDQSFTADTYSYGVKRIEDVNVIRSAQFAEDASPMAHPIRPASYQEMNNFYTVTVYNKGAEVIRMQHTLVGATGFRKGMDLYFKRHDGQAVTCDDFVAAIADANNIDLTQFKRWYAQAGTPVVTVTGTEYNHEAQSYRITFSQSCAPTQDDSPKEPFVIPIKTALLGPDGLSMATEYDDNHAQEHILVLNQTEQTFTFKGVTHPPVASLLRDFSAPVKLETQQSLEELLFLMANDNNEFNRWNAGQSVAKAILFKAVTAIQNGSQPHIPEGYTDALRATLTASTIHKSLIAEALSLPSKSALVEDMTTVDIDALNQAHDWLSKQIAQALEPDLLKVYKENPGLGNPLDRQAIAERKLSNLCLHYLCLLYPDHLVLAETQLNQTSMTSQIAALCSMLNFGDASQRTQAIDTFYTKWSDDALLMDKWLSLQAMREHKEAIQAVKALLKHPVYNDHNPNKVYALIISFTRNLTAFHQIDGSGYRFIADQVIHVDDYNPQVAARIVRALMNWKRFDAKRQTMMKAELQRIITATQLSKDVGEIVNKSLAD